MIDKRRMLTAAALALLALGTTACKLQTENLPVSLYEKSAPANALTGRLAYAQQDGIERAKVVILDAATGDKHDVPLPKGWVEDLAYSPSGGALAFAYGKDFNHSQIWVSGPDGSGPHQVTHSDGAVVDPSWSPDGSQLAVATLDTSGQWGLARVVAATGAMTPLGVGGAVPRYPAWMPDGRNIVYSARDDSQHYRLWSYDVLSGQSRRIASVDGDDLYPHAGPANGSIIFTAKTSTSSETMIRDSDGTVHQLVPSNSVEQWPAWGPGGSQVAVAVPHLAVYNASGKHFSGGALRWRLTQLPVWSPTWAG